MTENLQWLLSTLLIVAATVCGVTASSNIKKLRNYSPVGSDITHAAAIDEVTALRKHATTYGAVSAMLGLASIIVFVTQNDVPTWSLVLYTVVGATFVLTGLTAVFQAATTMVLAALNDYYHRLDQIQRDH